MSYNVRAIQSTEQVGIGYAIDKCMNAEWAADLWKSRDRWRWILIDHLEETLQIVKVGKRWKCNKKRVDAMDFELLSQCGFWPY